MALQCPDLARPLPHGKVANREHIRSMIIIYEEHVHLRYDGGIREDELVVKGTNPQS
jgi:hypothetical protein